MFDLSGKISELKDKMLGKKKEEKEETPAQLTDYDYIRKAARLMRRIVDDSRVDFAEGRQNHRRLLAAYCYGALAVFDRDNGERAALVRSVMYQMLTRKFLFPEAYSESLIEQLHRVREAGGDDALMEMIRRGEAYYERLQQGNRFLSARDAAAAFRMLLFEEENDIYIAAPGDERIHEFEKAHGVKFPEEYISFLKAHNGAVPVKGAIDCRNETYYVERFLPLLDKEALEKMGLIENQETLERLLPLEMDAVIQEYADRITEDLDLEEMYYIPIALLSGGNLACLDFGVYPDPPTVCIWLKEESDSLYPVLADAAVDFDDFLDRLYLVKAAGDQKQDEFYREYFSLADAFAELAGLSPASAPEEERQIFAAYCFGVLYSLSRERGAEMFQVQAAEIALLMKKFSYSAQESSQMFGVFVLVAGGEERSLAKEAIDRGMVDFYILKSGERSRVAQSVEDILRSAREAAREQNGEN